MGQLLISKLHLRGTMHVTHTQSPELFCINFLDIIFTSAPAQLSTPKVLTPTNLFSFLSSATTQYSVLTSVLGTT